MNRSESSRLEDVARLAEVSTATVSRALNRPDSVSDALRRRVLEAVDQLGYVPHGAARALASRRTRTIGAIVPTIDNAIFSLGLQHLQERLSGYGYTLLLASSDYDQGREQREVMALLEKGVDGLILVGEEHDSRVYQRLERHKTPHVNIWIHNPESRYPSVGFDNHGAARNLANYVLDIGHRRIAMIAGINRGNDRAVARTRGIADALEARGLSFHQGQYEERSYSIEEGRKAAGSFLSAASPPTAIVCGNDILALGALFECISRGIRVPEDISITGYDGIDLAAHVSPALTTVHIPCAEMGEVAADFLAARLEGRSVAEKTCLGTDLVIRSSTAPPRKT